MKNNVNRAQSVMKTTRYILLGLMMLVPLFVQAREYKKGEQIYVNVKQSWNWSDANAKLFLYFFQSWSDGTLWMPLSQYDGDTYAGTFTSDCMYDRVIVVRKEPSGTSGNWNNRWNQTCDIEIPNNKVRVDNKDVDVDINMLYTMTSKTNVDDNCGEGFVASETWKNYTPPVSKINAIISSLTAEEVKYCPNAVGDPFSLKAKLNTQKTEYVYTDVKGHGWYKSTNGMTWTSIDGYAGNARDGEKDINIEHKIESGVQYYYLHSNIPSGRRLLEMVALTSGCELDCSITSFETANSAVNADNNTFTLDGMVAFGEANGKALKIECGGKDTTIALPVSPQSFSLPGIPAATTDGQKTTAKAYFVGGGSACSYEIEIDVPNSTIAAETVTLDSLTGQQYVLVPADTVGSNQFVWLKKNEISGKTDTITSPWKKLTVDAIGHDSTVTYIYKEYNPAPGSMEDLMSNGSYEDAWDYAAKPVSDYDYWGTFTQTESTQINFYTNTSVNPGLAKKDNGFAVIRNAKNFAETYASVKPRQGDNFALFDAKSGTTGANKKAWYATTGSNAKLKLKKGTTYVLSFWAANINNYGEMDNAARFEFRIEYNGHTWKSKVLDLGSKEFRNNIWHQCSQTFYAPEDCDNVTISVVNLNTKSLNIGNDFALDDIQFHPISSVSRNVKSQQVFVVKAHEPKIDAFTATPQVMSCDATQYTVRLEVKYKNPKGNLVIKDHDGNLLKYSLPDIAYDTQGTFSKDTVITSLTPETLNWQVYFEDWTTATASTTSVAPGAPAIDTTKVRFSQPTCTETITTLTFDLNYTYQQGDFTYWVDDITPKQTATYEAAQKGKKTLNNLTFANIPADGKPTHKLHVEFSEANSCRKTYDLPAVPLSPVIDEVVVTNTIPAKVSCSTDSYEVKVKATTHYEATGKKIVFTYEDNGTKHDTAVVSGKTAEATLVLHNITEAGEPAATQTIYAAYEEYETCTKGSTTQVTAPQHAMITGGFDVTVSELACGETKYTISGQVAFDMADGDLIVEYDGTHRQVIFSPTSPATFTITGMEATGDNLTVKAWFSGSPDDACKAESKQFASPTVPHMAVETDYSYSPVTCNDETTTLSFKLKYTYQQGQLHYSVDDLTEQTQSISEKNKTEQTLTLAFAGIPADGKTHQLHVRFDGANSCPTTDVDLTAAPFSPVIRQVDATSVPATLTCENLTYPLELTITTPVDATGKQLEVSYTDGGADQKVTVDATGKSTKVELTLQDMDATKVFTVSYTDRPECIKPSDAITLPSKPTCLEIDTTICVGDSYTENGFNVIEPAVGYYEETNGFNTLRLTVVDQPAIQVSAMSMVCDEQTDVQFPYTVESGSPDNFRVTINGQEYAATSDGSHITISRPAEMKAGNYTAAITSSQSGAPCETTVQVQFIIAMSNRMYSKWEDLLFIDNHDSLFVAYQWYRNDAVIAGATKQYLYDKENKMAGTADVYYCQATTADGKVIYTCAETFDDVTPSRTVDHATNSPQRVITLYDITGTELQRLVTTDPEATIVPSRPGIYVLYEVQGNKTRATKIIVHE